MVTQCHRLVRGLSLVAALALGLAACGGKAGPSTPALDAATTDGATADVNVVVQPPLYGKCGSTSDCPASDTCDLRYPGGVCSRSCTSDLKCGSGYCVQGICLPGCTDAPSSCIALGAACVRVDFDTLNGVCAPACSVGQACGSLTCDPYSGECTATPRTGAANGAPCQTGAECAGAACRTTSVEFPNGYVGGYCISSGRQLSMADYEASFGGQVPQSTCPVGSAVVPNGLEQGMGTTCLARCADDAGCRTGYFCARPEKDDGTPAYTDGVCVPIDCAKSLLPNNGCPAGSTCVPPTYPGQPGLCGPVI